MNNLHLVMQRYHDVKLKNRWLGRGWSANNADVGEMSRLSMVTGYVTISACEFGFNPVMNPNRGFGCVCSVFEYVKNANKFNDEFVDARVDSDVNMEIEKITIETEKFIFKIFYNGNPNLDFHTIEINRKHYHSLGSGGNVYAPRRI